MLALIFGARLYPLARGADGAGFFLAELAAMAPANSIWVISFWVTGGGGRGATGSRRLEAGLRPGA